MKCISAVQNLIAENSLLETVLRFFRDGVRAETSVLMGHAFLTKFALPESISRAFS
jgi:hypothetical protein